MPCSLLKIHLTDWMLFWSQGLSKMYLSLYLYQSFYLVVRLPKTAALKILAKSAPANQVVNTSSVLEVPGTKLVLSEHKIKSTVIPVPSNSTGTLVAKSTVVKTIPHPYEE